MVVLDNSNYVREVCCKIPEKMWKGHIEVEVKTVEDIVIYRCIENI